MRNEEIKAYKAKTLKGAKANSIVCIKSEGTAEFELFVTDLQGVPHSLKKQISAVDYEELIKYIKIPKNNLELLNGRGYLTKVEFESGIEKAVEDYLNNSLVTLEQVDFLINNNYIATNIAAAIDYDYSEIVSTTTNF